MACSRLKAVDLTANRLGNAKLRVVLVRLRSHPRLAVHKRFDAGCRNWGGAALLDWWGGICCRVELVGVPGRAADVGALGVAGGGGRWGELSGAGGGEVGAGGVLGRKAVPSPARLQSIHIGGCESAGCCSHSLQLWAVTHRNIYAVGFLASVKAPLAGARVVARGVVQLQSSRRAAASIRAESSVSIHMGFSRSA